MHSRSGRPRSGPVRTLWLLCAFAGVGACTGHHDTQAANANSAPTHVIDARSDCLGRDAVVAIAAGQVGALHLDVSLDSLRRLCPNLRDTVIKGDEELDTAIVISRPGLSVVGWIATVEDGDGRHDIHIDPQTRFKLWTVVGSAGVLPGGVPLTAGWRTLVQLYASHGSVGYLNGEVDVSFCRALGLTLSMSAPPPVHTPRSATVAQVGPDSSRIVLVYVPTSPAAADSSRANCRELDPVATSPIRRDS